MADPEEESKSLNTSEFLQREAGSGGRVEGGLGVLLLVIQACKSGR